MDKKTVFSVEDKLRALYDLQLIDSRITLLGEFVLVIHSSLKTQITSALDIDFCKPFLDYMSPADASKLIAKITNHSKQDIYRFLISISNSS